MSCPFCGSPVVRNFALLANDSIAHKACLPRRNRRGANRGHEGAAHSVPEPVRMNSTQIEMGRAPAWLGPDNPHAVAKNGNALPEDCEQSHPQQQSASHSPRIP
jgi:hypothetical protein